MYIVYNVFQCEQDLRMRSSREWDIISIKKWFN